MICDYCEKPILRTDTRGRCRECGALAPKRHPTANVYGKADPYVTGLGLYEEMMAFMGGAIHTRARTSIIQPGTIYEHKP